MSSRARVGGASTAARRSPGWDADAEAADPGLVAKIVRLNLLVTKALDDIAMRAGLPLADYLVLGVVRRSPHERTTPGRICDVLRRTTGGMTLTLDRLERAGLLERSADQHDRRRVVVTLTAAGRDLAVSVNDDLHRWEQRLELSTPDRRQIDDGLDALLAIVED